MVTTTSAPWRGGELYMGLMVALSWLSTLALFCGSAVTTAQQSTFVIWVSQSICHTQGWASICFLACKVNFVEAWILAETIAVGL